MKLIRTCPTCHKVFAVEGKGNSRRRYCTVVCRNKEYTNRYREWRTAHQLAKYDAKALVPHPDKLQCLVCGRWYKQLGSHVVLRHGYKTAREYREEQGLDVKKGLTTGAYRQLLSDQVFETGTVNNLKNGAKYRFVPNDTRAGRYKRSAQTTIRLKQLTKYREAKFSIRKSIAKFFKNEFKSLK